MSAREPVQGMGSIVHEGGVAFRVWAPHAEEVSVIGEFNDWRPEDSPMAREGSGYWYRNMTSARVGQQYRFHLVTPHGEFSRVDPYARAVTNSVGNGIIHDPAFDWAGDDFEPPNWNEIVIYEMHIGSFPEDAGETPGTFDKVLTRIDHLKRLGVNAVQIMPVAEFAGDRSWGYNPAHIFAVESAYGLVRKQMRHFAPRAPMRPIRQGARRSQPLCGLATTSDADRAGCSGPRMQQLFLYEPYGGPDGLKNFVKRRHQPTLP